VTAELILHHYPVSPFAEKIRAILGYKKLAWRSVEIPMVLPKPDVVALTGGYRRTPLLQIGADVYCDTALIARVLERVAPEPSVYPDGDTLAVQAAAYFADNVLFNIAVPVGFQPGGMIKLFLPDATPEFLKRFGEDRAAMRQGGTVRRGRWPSARRISPACWRASRPSCADRSCSASGRASRTSRCITYSGRSGSRRSRARCSILFRRPSPLSSALPLLAMGVLRRLPVKMPWLFQRNQPLPRSRILKPWKPMEFPSVEWPR
jgi:glutathione S-transferase